MFLQGTDIPTDQSAFNLCLIFQYQGICKTLPAVRVFQLSYTNASVKLEGNKKYPEMKGKSCQHIWEAAGRQDWNQQKDQILNGFMGFLACLWGSNPVYFTLPNQLTSAALSVSRNEEEKKENETC